jgi:Fe2+ or Zn2+ uptake regulation protein
MSHQKLDYAARIREGGFRLTPQRELILNAICEGGGHTTLDEIYARVQAKAKAINLATVYRTLDFLCHMGLVVSAEIDSQKVYEIASQRPHHHLVCQECGRVQGLEHETVETLFTRLERERRFRVTVEHLVLYGLCQDCCEEK